MIMHSVEILNKILMQILLELHPHYVVVGHTMYKPATGGLECQKVCHRQSWSPSHPTHSIE